ncbi:MAG: hypothetical protein D6693_02555 [Planctomycetota bacterium]|nr:MAG: hypothetical protein D6693_02555 [Planctomycetota bacterium]
MSAITSATGAAPPSATNAFNDITSDEFIRIMFSELTNQDPLAPNDTKAVLDQISSIRSIESDLKLSDKLEALVSQNELASAGTLIGKFVSGLTDDGARVADLVLSVTQTRNGAVLNLASGAQVSMSRVEEIVDQDLINDILNAAADEPDSDEPADA